MNQQIPVRVAQRFELQVAEVGSVQMGYRNESYKLKLTSGETVNLIFHKNEREAYPRIKSADLAADVLSAASLPVRTRFDKRTLKVSDGKKEIYAGIYTYLPGATIPWEAYTKDHIKLLGWAMSDMHATWHGSRTVLPLHINDELKRLCGRMERYFDIPTIKLAMKEKLDLSLLANFKQYQRLFEKLQSIPELDEHILHMDLVRGNVLFDKGIKSGWQIDGLAITGVIDFEKAATGHPVYDIARTLAFLLVDCAGKDRHSVYKYFLQSGYNKRGRNLFKRSDTIAGVPAYQALNSLVGFFLLHDFYKFLKHTPYESLEANHHFVRTRDILVDYGMIRLDKD